MLFTLGVTALWTALRSYHGSSLPIAAFALTGYSTVLLWRNMPSRCIGAIVPNYSLLHHRYVKVIDIFASRVLLEAIGATISFVVLSFFFISLEWFGPPEDMLKVTVAWVLIAWFGAALGTLLGALNELSEVVDKFWHPMSYLMLPLSGAAFSVDALPATAQEYALWIPMVSGVELLREGFFGSQYRAHYDVSYFIFVNLVLTFLALFFVRAATTELRQE
jgi:ABC-type polysaccharide/polyol phosphate export permease